MDGEFRLRISDHQLVATDCRDVRHFGYDLNFIGEELNEPPVFNPGFLIRGTIAGRKFGEGALAGQIEISRSDALVTIVSSQLDPEVMADRLRLFSFSL